MVKSPEGESDQRRWRDRHKIKRVTELDRKQSLLRRTLSLLEGVLEGHRAIGGRHWRNTSGKPSRGEN